LRAAWRLLVAGEIGAERLVFVEEMGANVSLSALFTPGLAEGPEGLRQRA
jgi:hypothetical protein